MRTVRRRAHRIAAGKVAVRPGGVLSHAVSQPADPVRQAAAPVAVPAHGQLAGDRATVLRAAGGQDAHRDAHPGHAVERQQLQLAVHQLHVTLRLEADDRDRACLVVIPAPASPHCRATTTIITLITVVTLFHRNNNRVMLYTPDVYTCLTNMTIRGWILGGRVTG